MLTDHRFVCGDNPGAVEDSESYSELAVCGASLPAKRVLDLRAQYPGRPGLQDRFNEAGLPRL